MVVSTPLAVLKPDRQGGKGNQEDRDQNDEENPPEDLHAQHLPIRSYSGRKQAGSCKKSRPSPSKGKGGKDSVRIPILRFWSPEPSPASSSPSVRHPIGGTDPAAFPPIPPSRAAFRGAAIPPNGSNQNIPEIPGSFRTKWGVPPLPPDPPLSPIPFVAEIGSSCHISPRGSLRSPPG